MVFKEILKNKQQIPNKRAQSHLPKAIGVNLKNNLTG